MSKRPTMLPPHRLPRVHRIRLTYPEAEVGKCHWEVRRAQMLLFTMNVSPIIITFWDTGGGLDYTNCKTKEAIYKLQSQQNQKVDPGDYSV